MHMMHVDRKRKRNNEAEHRFHLLVAQHDFQRRDEYWVHANGKQFAVPGITDESGEWMPDYQTGIRRMMHVLGINE